MTTNAAWDRDTLPEGEEKKQAVRDLMQHSPGTFGVRISLPSGSTPLGFLGKSTSSPSFQSWEIPSPWPTRITGAH